MSQAEDIIKEVFREQNIAYCDDLTYQYLLNCVIGHKYSPDIMKRLITSELYNQFQTSHKA